MKLIIKYRGKIVILIFKIQFYPSDVFLDKYSLYFNFYFYFWSALYFTWNIDRRCILYISWKKGVNKYYNLHVLFQILWLINLPSQEEQMSNNLQTTISLLICVGCPARPQWNIYIYIIKKKKRKPCLPNLQPAF